MRPVALLFMRESPLLDRLKQLLHRWKVAGVGSSCESESRHWLGRPGLDLVIRHGEGDEDGLEALARQRGVDFVSLPAGGEAAELGNGTEARLEALIQRLPESAAHRRESDHLDRIIGSSREMLEVVEQVLRMAPSYAPILVTGESGTGKGLVARSIHDRSRNRQGPFVAVNCGAIPVGLVESHLFGHERGSFTGAHRRHQGVFEQAAGGTLFLDEVTALSPDAQVKLLRVLESGEAIRVGGERSIPVKCRVVTATNESIEEAVAEGRFREDLFYRLSVLQLPLPPLRLRRLDILELAIHFTSAISREEGRARELSARVEDRLVVHPWPGNVRELRNTIHSAVVLSGKRVIGEEDLVLEAPTTTLGNQHLSVPLGLSVKEVERRLILRTLSHLEGDKVRSADVLGISLKTLYNRLHDYGEMLPRSVAADASGPRAAEGSREHGKGTALPDEREGAGTAAEHPHSRWTRSPVGPGSH